MEPAIENHDQLRATINRVSFAQSCLDMGWEWEIHEALRPGIISTAPPHPPDSWKIRCSFQRPDTNTGEMGRGWGRWWQIDYGTSPSGVLKTMFAAAKMIVDHELMEAFKVDGVRPFDPHNDIESLKSIATAR